MLLAQKELGDTTTFRGMGIAATALLAITSVPVATHAATRVAQTVCTWSQQNVPLAPNMTGGMLNGISVASPTLAWAVGTYNSAKGSGSLIEKWNGSSWSVVGTGGPGVYLSDITSFGNQAVAMGTITTNGAKHIMVTAFNGTTWKRTNLPGSSPFLLQVSGSSPSDVWVVGEGPYVAHFNGNVWSAVTFFAHKKTVFGVIDFAPNDVWISASTRSATTWERFNGKTWTSFPVGVLGGRLAGTSDSDIWTIGFNPDGTGQNFQWNGSAWAQVGPGGELGYQLANAMAEPSPTEVWTLSPYPAEILLNNVVVATSIPTTDHFNYESGDLTSRFGLTFAVGSDVNNLPIVAQCR